MKFEINRDQIYLTQTSENVIKINPKESCKCDYLIILKIKIIFFSQKTKFFSFNLYSMKVMAANVLTSQKIQNSYEVQNNLITLIGRLKKKKKDKIDLLQQANDHQQVSPNILFMQKCSWIHYIISIANPFMQDGNMGTYFLKFFLAV